jgi:putative membrane protein
MLWLKAFHIFFMVSWFAGLFYLPRLFVYHCEVGDEAGHQRFCTMERRLFAIASIGMAGTVVFGLWLWLGYWPVNTGWLQAKFVLALALVAYHHWLIVPLRAFRARRNTRSALFYRIANEVPTVFLLAIVLLTVLKPGGG